MFSKKELELMQNECIKCKAGRIMNCSRCPVKESCELILATMKKNEAPRRLGNNGKF